MRINKLLTASFLLISLFGLHNVHAAKIYKKYNYYSISANSAQDLERGLKKNGPYLQSTGSHHPGLTTLRFEPSIKLKQHDNYCEITHISVDIHAKVILPRWKQRNSTKAKDLALIWDILAQDIKRHEESHIVIARSHASLIEKHIKTLPRQRDCKTLNSEIDTIAYNILEQHDEEQMQFDRIEAKTFEKRISRLLYYRIQRSVSGK